MIVNPFWLGVFTTVGCEAIALVIIAFFYGRKH